MEGVGWIGFDPANAICPHESHVRMAIGLDALDAACVRAAPAPLSDHLTRCDVRTRARVEKRAAHAARAPQAKRERAS